MSTVRSIPSASRLPEVERPALRAPGEIHVDGVDADVVGCDRVARNQSRATAADDQIELLIGDVPVDVAKKNIPAFSQQISRHQAGPLAIARSGAEVLRMSGIEDWLAGQRDRPG